MPTKPSGGHTKPRNNQIFELFYDFDLQTHKLSLNLEKGCKSLGGTEEQPTGVPGVPKTICEADFERCIAGWPHRKPCIGETRLQIQSDFSISKVVPGTCATHHECNPGFPYVNSVEQ